ncbi:MAG TPA: histidine phosphatase family protein [Cellulomonas sp.]
MSVRPSRRSRLTGTAVAAMLLLAGCGGGSPAAPTTSAGSADTGATAAAAAPTTTGDGTGDVTVYLVRHGETVFNLLGQMSGWSDSPLTPDGEELADTAGQALAGHDFVAAYASDLGRTRQTAERVLAAQGDDAPELVTMPELREWSFGGFEGMPNDDAWGTILAEHGYDWAEVQRDYAGFAEEAGGATALATMVAESDPLGLAQDEAAITERMRAGFDRLVAEVAAAGGGEVLVVSHGMAIGSLLALLDPEGYQPTAMHNLALSVVEVRGGRVEVVSAGETDYLGAADA